MAQNQVSTFVDGFHNITDVQRMTYTPLGRTGMQVSKIGFGGVQLGLVKSDTKEEREAIDVIIQAVKSGVNYLDVAPWYGFGAAEVVLGKALRELPRKAYYVGTKVGRYLPEYKKMFDFSYERTLASVEKSLQKLGVDYIDVIQVHDLEFAPSLDIILEQTLPALQKVIAEGKAKYIGLTGYPVDKLKEVVVRSRVPIDIVLSYCRWNLFDRTLEEFMPFFNERGIGVINAAFLGMGLLTSAPLPLWHPAGAEVRQLCQKALKCCQNKDVDLAKLATCYVLNNSQFTVNLIGFNSKDLLEKNFDAFLNGLNSKEEDVLKTLLESYFVSNNHWEGIEVAKYWRKVKSKDD